MAQLEYYVNIWKDPDTCELLRGTETHDTFEDAVRSAMNSMNDNCRELGTSLVLVNTIKTICTEEFIDD